MPRLGSKKSRTGCTQCKARRVKCDENRPCGACTKYRVDCSLLVRATSQQSQTASPRASSTTSEGIQTTPPSADVQPDSTVSSTSDLPIDYRIPSVPADVSTGKWIEDLELIHHYTAHAHLTIPGSEHTKQIWGYAVPQEAFKFPFLMHGILAFSANHLAHINPSSMAHFQLLASTHQTAALTNLNQALGDIQPINSHAIFVAASMTVMNAFADARTYNTHILIENFQLLRGLEYVLQKVTPMIEKGPFAAIVRRSVDPPKPSPLLSSLLVELQASCSPPDNPTSMELARAHATEALRSSLQYSLESSPHPALRAAMLWPIKLEAEHIEMLKTLTDPGIRSLFKQYCRLLEYASTEFWFVAGWRGIAQQV